MFTLALIDKKCWCIVEQMRQERVLGCEQLSVRSPTQYHVVVLTLFYRFLQIKCPPPYCVGGDDDDSEEHDFNLTFNHLLSDVVQVVRIKVI